MGFSDGAKSTERLPLDRYCPFSVGRYGTFELQLLKEDHAKKQQVLGQVPEAQPSPPIAPSSPLLSAAAAARVAVGMCRPIL